MSNRDDTCRDCGARSATRSAGSTLQRPRIARSAGGDTFRCRADRELRCGGSTDRDKTRFTESRHQSRVRSRNEASGKTAAQLIGSAGARDAKILDEKRNASKGLASVLVLQRGWSFVGPRLDNSVNRRIDALYRPVSRIDYLIGSDRSLGNQLSQADGVVRHIVTQFHCKTPK